MDIINSVISAIMAFFTMISASLFTPIPERAENFRVSAYLVASNMVNPSDIDPTHFDQLTDVIVFGIATFNEDGEIVLNSNFDTIVENIKNAMSGSDADIYLNLLGPGSKISGETWEDNMNDQSKWHNKAFNSGVMEKNIKEVLKKYDFDGVCFDYEYPVTRENWAEYDRFLISLDKYLGDEFELGAAMSPYNSSQSRKAIAVLDFVEVMAYDLFEKDGTHASISDMKAAVRAILAKGYKKEKIDIGIPFYGRPTNRDAYWYGYNGWYDKLDEKGFCLDDGTGLTFSFNTYDTVYRKTEWAIKKGLGGAMIWHYSCDVPQSNPASLFNAIQNAKSDLINQS